MIVELTGYWNRQLNIVKRNIGLKDRFSGF